MLALPAHQLLAGFGQRRVKPGADPGGDRAAQRGGFFHHRHPHRQAGDVAEDLAPQFALRTAAGEHQRAGLHAGEGGDLLQITG